MGPGPRDGHDLAYQSGLVASRYLRLALEGISPFISSVEIYATFFKEVIVTSSLSSISASITIGCFDCVLSGEV